MELKPWQYPMPKWVRDWDNYKNNNDFNLLELGDLFIMDAAFLQKCSINQYTDGYKEFGMDYIKPDIHMPIIVKYIGNDLAEEMITGEKITMNYFKSIFEFKIDSVNAVYTGDYRQKSYYDKLNGYLSFASKAAIIYCANMYRVSHELKKEYLKYTDEERKELLGEMKKIATESRDEVVKEIKEKLAAMGPTKEEIDEAYYMNREYDLDNQIRDFRNKGKTK